MLGRWPFKKVKPDPEASSLRKKAKSLPPKKQCDRPYLNVALARSMYKQNRSVGVRDVHLPAGGSSMRRG
jgi:hypothetical protein